MSACPINHLVAALDGQVPARIAALPVSRGFPVPWFVAEVNGEYDFRVMDRHKMKRAVKESLCWVCGERLGKFKTFVIGPMCGINQTAAEPPSHLECARYSATHCPFLTIPHMKRREKGLPEDAQEMAGKAILRNPGVTLLWTITSYTLFPDPNGKALFSFPDPVEVEWYAEGRKATHEEALEAVKSGLPFLREACDQEPTPEIQAAAHYELEERIGKFQKYLPKL